MDWTKSQKEILVQMLVREHEDAKLELDWIDVGIPERITPTLDIPRNTRILVIHTPESEYRGNRNYYYNRLDIKEFLHDGMMTEEELVADPLTAINHKDLYIQLSDLLKIRIDKDMIVDRNLPLIGSTPVVVQVDFNPQNLTITGSIHITLARA